MALNKDNNQIIQIETDEIVYVIKEEFSNKKKLGEIVENLILSNTQYCSNDGLNKGTYDIICMSKSN